MMSVLGSTGWLWQKLKVVGAIDLFEC